MISTIPNDAIAVSLEVVPWQAPEPDRRPGPGPAREESEAARVGAVESRRFRFVTIWRAERRVLN